MIIFCCKHISFVVLCKIFKFYWKSLLIKSEFSSSSSSSSLSFFILLIFLFYSSLFSLNFIKNWGWIGQYAEINTFTFDTYKFLLNFSICSTDEKFQLIYDNEVLNYMSRNKFPANTGKIVINTYVRVSLPKKLNQIRIVFSFCIPASLNLNK